jgi:hypothetical protein
LGVIKVFNEVLGVYYIDTYVYSLASIANECSEPLGRSSPRTLLSGRVGTARLQLNPQLEVIAASEGKSLLG